MVKQLTIRGLSRELLNAIKNESGRRGLNINRCVLSILRESVGLGDEFQKSGIEFHDLDHLAGTWTQHEYEEFEKQLDLQRIVEKELQ